ncbi:MAG: TatD family hydrolase [Bacteroidales bacterium]|jgi:TatD DNase family protein|nr:TatD family hydrolase [Bacteroidales bacterium]
MKNEFTDTHTHLYLEAFSADSDDTIKRALAKGVTRMFLPNLDSSSVDDMMRLCECNPGVCFPMIGLHPTSVKKNFKDELKTLKKLLHDEKIIAVGEIGIDLYWDKTFIREQQEAFRTQLRWAKDMSLPVVIHARESFQEIFQIIDEENVPELKGVFHSFTGNADQAQKILNYGFYIGINGIVTFKNSGLQDVVKIIPPEKLLIETDSPFLAPHPYRGKRNESSYVIEVATKIAELHTIDINEVAAITTKNALTLFKRVS